MRPDVQRFLLDYAAAHSKSLDPLNQAAFAFQEAYDYLSRFVQEGAGLSDDEAQKLFEMLTRFQALEEKASFLDEGKADAVRQLSNAFLEPRRSTLQLRRSPSAPIHF
ncbi:hypothetical protein [Rhodoferax sp.]|uniref:hypothetical protein n=1 Tax=Rhodoferax sp. TaxID=50421 RepID=UPI00262CA6F5|nr:hypothetical protein [Rhodoferax sp.]